MNNCFLFFYFFKVSTNFEIMSHYVLFLSLWKRVLFDLGIYI